MAILPIRRFGDPVLRKKAEAVDIFDASLSKLIQDLKDTMSDASGAGLAAPQIGISKRVIVWRNSPEAGSLANPQIISAEGSVESEEACLSIPGLAFPVERAERILVSGLNLGGVKVTIEAEDMTARILQHEIDHLDGVLFIDRLPRKLQKEAKRMLREQTMGEMTSEAPVL
jgi:peptide deformylase